MWSKEQNNGGYNKATLSYFNTLTHTCKEYTTALYNVIDIIVLVLIFNRIYLC